MENLATSYWCGGKNDKAIELEEQVLKKRCKVLGESHFRTLTTMGILARFYGPKNTKKAVELLIQMLEKERIIHEKEHLVQ